jgi:hypothetical protein
MPNSHKGQNNLLDGTWGPSALTQIYGTSPFQLCHPSFRNKAHQPILVVLFHVIALHALHSGGPPVWAMRPYPKPSNSNSNSAFQGPYLAVKSQRTLGFDPWNFQWLVMTGDDWCSVSHRSCQPWGSFQELSAQSEARVWAFVLCVRLSGVTLDSV